ncbi:MAG: DNA topoisomerase IV subunit A [Candidatus Bathyarchaeia archaeon]
MRETSFSARERRKDVLLRLENFGRGIYEHLEKGFFPQVAMPSRSTDNIYYDANLRQYVLGDKKKRRSAGNIRHVRSVTQLVWMAYFVHELTLSQKTSTLRDVFYSAQAYDIPFESQDESDNIITDLESILGYAREDFNVFPEERSAVFGDLTIEYTIPNYEGRRLNLTSHPDGVMIGPALTSAEFIETSADKIIAIEKGGLFTRFIEERVHERFNAVLVLLGGQAPRSTRYFIRRLNQELGLPVYVFSDADPWGMHIAMVIISGSANAAHLRDLTTPDAKWAGVWASDIVNYKLPSEKLDDLDLKRLNELMRDPRYKEDLWQRELKIFMKTQRKCELEAFSRYGLTHIVDKYLPERLRELE